MRIITLLYISLTVRSFLIVESTLEIRIIFSFLMINFTGDLLPLSVFRLFNKNPFRNILHRNFLANQLFNLMEVVLLSRITKGYGLTLLKCSPGPSDAVHIILNNNRYLEVNNVTYIAYIEASCCHVSGHQNP